MASTQPTFDQLAAAYRAEFRPVGLEQERLVDELVHAQWNTLRFRELEDQVWEKLLSNSDHETPADAFIADCKGPKVIEKL